MEENGKRLTCRQAKELDLVEYLYQLGYAPAKIRGNNFWYRSPLRQEKTPSFKVNRLLNRWFDFGIGKGGTILDLGLLFYKCSLSDLLVILSRSDLPHIAPFPITNDPAPQIVVISVKPLSHPALTAYLLGRKIPSSLASKFCKEVVYQNGSRNYFAIGFENDLGGYELRNCFFKGSSSPKGLTHIQSGSDTVLVFEGFMDFLSYLLLTGNANLIVADIIVLNGLSFFEKATPVMDTYQRVYLFLDNDSSGQNCSAQAVRSNPKKITNLHHLYKNAKDLNDFLCSGGAFDLQALPIVLKPP